MNISGALLALILILSVTPSALAQAPRTHDEDPEFVRARQLFWSGQYQEAEKAFTFFLVGHPDHRPSQNFLKMIVQSRIHDDSKIDLTRARLKKIHIRKIHFKDADWESVTHSFQDLANPKSNDVESKNSIHFINMLPTKFTTKITLDLKDVSLLDAIEAACRQAGLRYVVDTWAVIVDIPESKK